MIGVDVGTAFIVCCKKSDKGLSIKSMRNCFLKVDTEDIDMMKSATNSTIVELDDEYFILGDQCMGFTALKADIRRPMANGILNPNEEDANILLSKILEILVGQASFPGEIVCASIPAETSDGKINPIHHRKIVEKAFTDLGYDFVEINEGLAVVYATNPKTIDENGEEHPMSGIGISMGGGMVNVCYAHDGKKLLSFSIARSGDWIDQQSSESFGTDESGKLIVTPARIAQFKERYFSFKKSANDFTEEELAEMNFKTKHQKKRFKRMYETIDSYYSNLIRFILFEFTKALNKAQLETDNEMEIVLSGGTSMPEGLDERFQEILKEDENFPLVITRVRKADNPLNSTAIGALAKATMEEKKRLKSE